MTPEIAIDGLVIGGVKDGKIVPVHGATTMWVPTVGGKGRASEDYKLQEFWTAEEGKTPKLFRFWVPFGVTDTHGHIMKALVERYQEAK